MIPVECGTQPHVANEGKSFALSTGIGSEHCNIMIYSSRPSVENECEFVWQKSRNAFLNMHSQQMQVLIQCLGAYRIVSDVAHNRIIVHNRKCKKASKDKIQDSMDTHSFFWIEKARRRHTVLFLVKQEMPY